MPARERPRLEQILAESPLLGRWSRPLDDELLIATAVVRAEDAEKLLDALEAQFSSHEEFRTVVLEPGAVLPEPSAQEPVAPEFASPSAKEERGRFRISRGELYAEIAQAASLTPIYAVMTTLSTAVVCIGLLRDHVAVVIGAMVIAPLLGPNVALSLATTLWDRELLRRAVSANAVGLAIVFVFSVAVGAVVGIDPSVHEIALRSNVGVSDVAVALASGAAGALSFTTGAPASLIGVMVAVALLPPLATLGMLLGAGLYAPAMGALLLFLVNVIGVNLAGVVTFFIQGVRPRRWWEAERAARAARLAMVLWVVLLSLLLAAILLRQHPNAAS